MSEQSKASFFKCLDCGANDFEDTIKAWQCSGCGRNYPVAQGIPLLVRQPEAHEEELARAREVNPAWYHEEQFPEDASPWRHHLKKRRLFVEDALKRHLAESDLGGTFLNLLDLGCGDGHNLRFLSKYCQNLYGSDYNQVRLARAKAMNPDAQLFLADILDYPAQDDFFDLVYFNHVLEHIPDDRAALRTVFRILKPGGMMVLGVPNEGCWWWQLAYKNDPQSLETTDHFHFYTASGLEPELTAEGFVVQETKHMGWGPPSWRWDMKTRKYKVLDDLFEILGKMLLPRQSSSLYLLATKPT